MLDRSVGLTISPGAHGTAASAEAAAWPRGRRLDRGDGPSVLDVTGEQMTELLSLGPQVALVLDGSPC